MNLSLEQFGIDRLGPQQKLELIDLIWNSIPDSEPFNPPDWHVRELERRVAAADANPANVETWETLVERLHGRRDQRELRERG